jgi:hypothetical protein
VVTAEGLSTTGETSSASTELFLTPFRDMVFPTGEVPTVNVTVVGEPDASTITLSIVSSGMVPLLTLDSESSAGPGYWSDSSFLAFPGRAVVVKYTLGGRHPALNLFGGPNCAIFRKTDSGVQIEWASPHVHRPHSTSKVGVIFLKCGECIRNMGVA